MLWLIFDEFFFVFCDPVNCVRCGCIGWCVYCNWRVFGWGYVRRGCRFGFVGCGGVYVKKYGVLYCFGGGSCGCGRFECCHGGVVCWLFYWGCFSISIGFLLGCGYCIGWENCYFGYLVKLVWNGLWIYLVWRFYIGWCVWCGSVCGKIWFGYGVVVFERWDLFME